jgi:Mrp family chromosome partitioning ATPase/capsular polysaccharide biosynthesis protein
MATTDEGARDLRGYLTIFRRGFWLSALVTLLTVGAAAAYTFYQPVLYQSKMKLVVGAEGALLPPDVVNAADQLTQTMSELLLSEVVATRAIQQLGYDMQPQALLSRLRVTTKPETAVLQLSYVDEDQARATGILDTVGQAFIDLVNERVSPPTADLRVSVSVFNPSHPTGQIQPRPVRNLAVAVMLGGFLGLAAAFVREQLDDTIRSVEEAERAFGQAATISLAPGIVGHRPLDRRQHRKLDPIITELALQRLRASILWSPESRAARTLLVTSANPEEGKSTVAANLAVLMVTEGRNVIVVEGDLRQPSLHRYLGMPPPASVIGLDEIMRGEVAVSEALIEIPVPARTFAPEGLAGSWAGRGGEPLAPGRLRAILAPPVRTNPFDIGLSRTVEIIDELRGMADFVIFDAAPILVVPDAFPFIVSVDTVIAVVRNGKATAKATAALSRSLERVGARRVELVVTEAESAFAQTSYYGHRTGERVRAARPRPAAPPIRPAERPGQPFGPEPGQSPARVAALGEEAAPPGVGPHPREGGAER